MTVAATGVAAQDADQSTDFSNCSPTLFGGAIKNHVENLDCPSAITNALNCVALGDYMEEILNDQTISKDEKYDASAFVGFNALQFGCLGK